MSTTATILERELEWAPGEDLPYVMHLPGQRALALTIPAAWVVLDKTGEVCLRPPAVHWLDKLRALYSRLETTPTPGFIRVLREAMNLTQAELAQRIRVNKMTVSRWERGTAKPSDQAIKLLVKIRASALRRGLLVEADAG